MRNLFISYRRADTRWIALALRQGLRPLLDVRVFMDIESIDAGEDFVEAINRSVDGCDALIAVIGPDWLKAQDRAGRRRIDYPQDFVRLEIERALAGGKRVVPLLIEGAEMPAEADLPESLRPLARRNARRLTFESYASDVEGLAAALAALGFARAGAEAPPAPEPEPLDRRPPVEDGLAALWREAEDDAGSLFFLAHREFDRGDYALAERAYAAVAERAAQEGGETALLTLRARLWRAVATSRLGAPARGLEMLEPVMAALARTHGTENTDAMAASFFRAQFLLALGRTAEAEAAYAALLSIRERVLGAEHPDTLATRHELAHAWLALGRTAEAEAAFAALLPVMERVRGAEHPHTLVTRHDLARARLALDRAADAEAALAALLQVAGRVQGAEHPHTLMYRARLAEAVLAQGRAAEAAGALAGLAEVAARVWPVTNPRPGFVALLRAEAAAALGDEAAAERFAAEAEGRFGGLAETHEYRRRLAAFRARSR